MITAAGRVVLERAQATHPFTGWDKTGRLMLQANTLPSVFKHRCAYFRRKLDGAVFRYVSRNVTERLEPDMIEWVTAIHE